MTETRYQNPPNEILEILDARPIPSVSISPDRRWVLLVNRTLYPPITELAAPVLRLAGLRINPTNFGPHLAPRYCGLTLRSLESGEERAVPLPEGSRITLYGWSPDATRYAFTLTSESAIHLWIMDAQTATAEPVTGLQINATLGHAVQWFPDSQRLLVQSVEAGRPPAPEKPRSPAGPLIEESSGSAGPVRTFPDLLQSPHDEDLLEYYCQSTLAIVKLSDRTLLSVGPPGLYSSADVSPDGNHILCVRHQRPFSYTLPIGRFPRRIEVIRTNGDPELTLAVRPLEINIPIEGVPEGPRSPGWCPTQPATLFWVEALDGGDPRNRVPFRDVIRILPAPFTDSPGDLIHVEQRCTSLMWGESNGLAFVRDYDRDRRWTRTLQFDSRDSAVAPRVIWERSVNDRYGDPGNPLTRPMKNGRRVLWQHEDWLFLEGDGATPRGDRPFLARFHLKTHETERLFTCDDQSLESVVGLISADGLTFITQHETPVEPPNYFVRSTAGRRQAITQFPDPMPQLRNIRKELVTYTRSDGVPLSFMLYLPPSAKPGEPLPTIVWAYPKEFNDASTAGQVSGSTNRFTAFGGISHLFLLTQGYAVLDDTMMPVVGDPETANNTFIEQITASAQAAVDKAVEMGVTDRNRVGIGGHSYGAFMTAHLLAQTSLFKAGVARSGAYNRTLTPFGFQNERRTFWEAPQIYQQLSPFASAHRIRTPLLLIHGEADNNPGTFPIQTERFYQAVRGNGGTVRYVLLPHEAHHYVARESVEHTLWEMIRWFDMYVKNGSAS